MYICINVYMYKHTHVSIHISIFMCIYISICTYLSIYTYVCIIYMYMQNLSVYFLNFGHRPWIINVNIKILLQGNCCRGQLAPVIAPALTSDGLPSKTPISHGQAKLVGGFNPLKNISNWDDHPKNMGK